MQLSKLRSGTTVEGNEILSYVSDKNADKYIYLMGGVHGDEVEGVYVANELHKWLEENDKVNLPIVVIPILNVDGYRSSSRVNSHGVDLNRNMPTTCWESEYKEAKNNPGKEPLSEPENQYLMDLFKRFKPGFILTLHSWKPIVNYNGDCLDVAEHLAKHNKYPIADDIGYPCPGSLGTYGSVNLEAPVLTFEFPTLDESGKSLKEIWSENKEDLKTLFTENILNRFLN